MQKMNWKLFLVLSGFLLQSPFSLLFGQGFDRGKLILFGNGAFGIGDNSGTMEKKVEETNFPGYLALNTPYADLTSNYANYYIVKSLVAKRTELSSHIGELGFEYGIFRNIGIGLSVSNQTITASSFRSIDERYIVLFALMASDSGTLMNRLNQGDISDAALQKRRAVFNSTSGDLNLFFHFKPNDPIDPYIRVGGGAGYERLFGGATNRIFGAFGVRYHFDELFFLNAELEHSNVYMVKYETPNSGHRNKGNFEESFFKFGMGMSFPLHGSNSPEPEIKTTKVVNTVESEVPTQTKEPVLETKLDRFVFLASEIFDLPSSRIHLEGRARLDAIARSLENEYKDFDVQVITYTTPFREDVPGNYENYDLGFERSQAISRVLREKGVNSRRIIDSTQGSAMYNVDSKEKVVIELRKKN
ncbi:hypothetical protein EHQ68_00855 [Leptospira congkakensis]|uniref:OmpA-like domain-containing protein n=1 Tax=Leptospira congkakensis TaxID=2484932 RepID=A0A4Z1ACG9_9LEPT|nr:OmpA family protein [Leptospira congkakensis]TGL87942.1 hypothetical protein EHQ69_17790 [Leptospira congkakensis]TGL92719.1 hypothetical protein EHQ68_00855 [Leptospira congkakensis]TGL96092.1 hypothetical protein EHQ70_13460 [Leptospira congkakensis]